MTSAVVLAAGMGTRLSANAGRPKWLVEVGDTCPADVQMEGLVAAGIDRVAVVAGPGADELEERLAAWRSAIEILLVPNPRHRELNNWYSLLLGARSLAASARPGGVVVINSDLFASDAWMERALRALSAASAPAALAVDTVRPLTAEAMKVSADDAAVHLGRIGKTDVERPVGEYVGMAWWSATAAAELCEILEGFADVPERANHWYEHAIDEHLQAGACYQLVRVPSSDWVEIDDDDDLALARRLGVGPPATLDDRSPR